jgi:hypothetical protein
VEVRERERARKKSDSSHANYESMVLRKFVDAVSSYGLEFESNVRESKSSRYVLLHLLLLCMRVRWRGRTADLRIFS